MRMTKRLQAPLTDGPATRRSPSSGIQDEVEHGADHAHADQQKYRKDDDETELAFFRDFRRRPRRASRGDFTYVCSSCHSCLNPGCGRLKSLIAGSQGDAAPERRPCRP